MGPDCSTVLEIHGPEIAFAGSGGLDSCTITRWLTDRGFKVICFCADLGQPDETDINDIERRMILSGAAEFHLLPLQRELANAGIRAVQEQACYEGGYWNTTGIARHVIASAIVPAVSRRGLNLLAHGSTGRGNDQFRFQIIANLIDPKLGLYAPWRDPEYLAMFKGRKEMIEFCRDRNIPVRASMDAPYSTDANILGLTHEAGALEALDCPVTRVEPGMGNWAEQSPDVAEECEIRFAEGRPIAVNGDEMDPIALFKALNSFAGRHAVGIGVHVVENRIVGLKSRGVYEQPGIELLGVCYEYLLQLVMDRSAREYFNLSSAFLGRQIYRGYWYDLASHMASSAIAPVTALLSGTIRVRLYKGHVLFISATDVPHSLYREADVSMEAVGTFDHSHSEGMLRITSLSARALAESGQAYVPH